MKKENIIYSALSALFVVLISLGAYMKINIPGSPVPIVLQNMFIMITALALGKKWGSVTVIVYLVTGLIGLPVFAGGTSGPAVFFGPTGGYLLAYLPAVFIAGYISECNLLKNKVILNVFAMVAAITVIYIMGVAWLKYRINAGLGKALLLGFYPYIGWDILKAVAAITIAEFIRPVLKNVFEK